MRRSLCVGSGAGAVAGNNGRSAGLSHGDGSTKSWPLRFCGMGEGACPYRQSSHSGPFLRPLADPSLVRLAFGHAADDAVEAQEGLEE